MSTRAPAGVRDEITRQQRLDQRLGRYQVTLRSRMAAVTGAHKALRGARARRRVGAAAIVAVVGLGAAVAVAKERTEVKTSVTLKFPTGVVQFLGHGEGKEGLSGVAQGRYG